VTDTQTSGLAQALAELQANLPEIKKTERADTGKFAYDYANLTTISDAILPLLSKHGLAFIAKPSFDGERFVLAYSLLHKSGEREDGQYPLPTTGTPQAIGSAITYGRRYCLCAVTGIAPDTMDDDGAQAEAEARKGTAQRARPRPAQQASGRQAQRSRPTAKAPEPPLPGEEEQPDDGITQKQLGMLHATFSEMGITDRDAGLAYIADVVGHEVESSKDLTKKQASQVIDRLKKDLEQPFPEEGDA